MPRNAARLDAWNERSGSNPDLLDEVRVRLDDDLDTPGAIELVDAAARAGAGVGEAAALLGVELDLRLPWYERDDRHPARVVRGRRHRALTRSSPVALQLC